MQYQHPHINVWKTFIKKNWNVSLWDSENFYGRLWSLWEDYPWCVVVESSLLLGTCCYNFPTVITSSSINPIYTSHLQLILFFVLSRFISRLLWQRACHVKYRNILNNTVNLILNKTACPSVSYVYFLVTETRWYVFFSWRQRFIYITSFTSIQGAR